MDTRVLKYFLTVANTNNITKAAKQLHITQPTLSRQIMELEKELDVALFDRTQRQLQLTKAGVLFQPPSSSWSTKPKMTSTSRKRNWWGPLTWVALSPSFPPS